MREERTREIENARKSRRKKVRRNNARATINFATRQNEIVNTGEDTLVCVMIREALWTPARNKKHRYNQIKSL